MKKWIIGIDEVGRGPLAGPVYVCAVAIPFQTYKKMRWQIESTALADSKVMTPLARERWHNEARRLEHEGSIRIAIAYRHASTIDSLGISACIRSCIKSVLGRLEVDPEEAMVVLDGGLYAPEEYLSQQTIIRGDKSQKVISLAAVVAKVTRDNHMRRLHKAYPEYCWFENKGYGTRAHIETLLGSGITPIHRKSFCAKILSE